jgi:hypothetical protein
MHVIELDVDVDHSFYCPVTGQLILAPEDYKPSPATAFVLPPEAEDFDAMQPRLRKIWDKVKAASDDEDPQPWQLFEDFCKELEHDENLVLFSLTSHGMACGPVSSTVHVCIDFAHGSEDFDDDEDE